MARYIIPSITIPALYGAYKTYWVGRNDKKIILSVDEAVDSLNKNVNITESLNFIQKSESKEFLKNINLTGLALLARSGSKLCLDIPVKSCLMNNMNVSQALSKYNLGDKWNSSIEWINRVACPEEDLSCSDEWLVRLPSQIERLRRMLQLLFLTTENNFNYQSIDADVVQFLFNVYAEFFDSNQDIALLTLKIMANIVGADEKYAKSMLQSEWLPLIGTMVSNGKSLMEKLISHKICQNALYSLGAISYSLRSDIHEVYVSNEEPELDIVLIHGLRGSVAYTWRQKGSAEDILTTCWPKDWLPLDIKRPFRIIGLDYPSYIIQFTGTQYSLQSRADRFKKQLEDAEIGKRPILFICHSMGGLLAKKLLLDCPNILEKTVGVMFLATPHRGTPVASWSYSFLYPTDDVLLLREKNELNSKLNNDFAAISNQIPIIVSMVETIASDIIGTAKGIIVPTNSAVFDRGAVYHIDDIHLNICKPSRASASYSIILNCIMDCFQEADKRKQV